MSVSISWDDKIKFSCGINYEFYLDSDIICLEINKNLKGSRDRNNIRENKELAILLRNCCLPTLSVHVNTIAAG